MICDIAKLVAEYLDEYKLLDWVDIKNINWYRLSLNSNDEVIKLLKANPEKINWSALSVNSNDEAVKLLKANLDKINWYYLSTNYV